VRPRERLLRACAESAAGALAIGLVAALCFRFGLKLAAPLCLDLIVVVLLSLRGSFVTSAVVSVVAVACLDYFFTEPLFSPLIFDPIDVFALALFLLTAGVITTLVSRLRMHTEQLAITNRKLEEQIAEVKHAQDQLSLARVNRVMLLGEMTASIAHEVNQPLTGILANGGTALRYLGREVPDLEQVRRYLGLIVNDVKRAAAVTARVRAMAKKEPPRTIPLDVNDTILEVIELTKRDLSGKQIELRTELANGLPLVPADRVQLQQVLLNLIVNAIDAMCDAAGGPRDLAVRSGTDDGTGVFVEVRDSGPGLDPASLERLFASFYTTKTDGMGMGLSICRSIVEAHGGRLWARPNEPHGAVFRFTLPVAPEIVRAYGP
jgi:signal transduction histidine kinase